MALRQATERMTLDVSRLEVQTSLAVTQGDTMRRWEIKLTDRGQPIEIGKRWTAALSGIKPDGKVIYNGCTVQDGRIFYDFASGTEIATAAGAYEITLEVYDEAGEILHAPKIWLNVLKNRNRDVASQDQFTAAQEIIRRINEAEEDIDGIEQTNEQQGDDIEAAQGAIQYLESKTTTVQTVSVPKSSWTNSDTVNVILDKPAPASNALIIPANADTRRQVVICQIEVEDERETEDGWIVSLSRSEVIPETDLEFVVYVMRGDTEREIDSTALLLAPAGGEANIRIADDLTTDIGYVALSARMGKKLNEEKVPTTRTVNKKPLSADVNLTAEDVDAAPKGFGLGTEAKPISDMNTQTECGWIAFGVGCKNAPFNYGVAEVINRYGNQVVQVAYDVELNTNTHNGTIAKRVKGLNASEWSEWEWVNPPMRVGVEYRTTERRGGKPVYALAVDLGSMPNNDLKDVYFKESINSANVISYEACMTSSDYGARTLPDYNEAGELRCFAVLLNSCVRIKSYHNLSYYTGKMTIKFTKE